jgi:hypothetical protein
MAGFVKMTVVFWVFISFSTCMVRFHIQISILPPHSGWMNLIQVHVKQYIHLRRWNKPYKTKNQKTAIMWTSNTTMFDTGLILQNFLTSITKTVTYLHLWFVLCWDFWLSSFQRLFLGHVSFLHCWHLSLPSTMLQLVLKYWKMPYTWNSTRWLTVLSTKITWIFMITIGFMGIVVYPNPLTNYNTQPN